MAYRFILLAHAETEATRAASFPGDEPLTPRGRAACAALQDALPRPARAWRSPASAARETAEALGLEATATPGLADLDCGTWRGLSLTEVAAHDPQGLAAWMREPGFEGHGGESIDALLQRVSTWIEARLGEPGTTLAVTHAAIVRCAVLAVVGAPTAGFWRIDVSPLTRVEFGGDGRRWTLRTIVKP